MKKSSVQIEEKKKRSSYFSRKFKIDLVKEKDSTHVQTQFVFISYSIINNINSLF